MISIDKYIILYFIFKFYSLFQIIFRSYLKKYSAIEKEKILKILI